MLQVLDLKKKGLTIDPFRLGSDSVTTFLDFLLQLITADDVFDEPASPLRLSQGYPASIADILQ